MEFLTEEQREAYPVNWIKQQPLSRFRRPFRYIVEDVYFRYFQLSFGPEEVNRNSYGVGLYNPSIMQNNLGQHYLRNRMPFEEAKRKLTQAAMTALDERYTSFSDRQKEDVISEVIEYLHHHDPQKWWSLQINAGKANKRSSLIFANVWNNIVDLCDEKENVSPKLRGQGKLPMPELPSGTRGGNNVIALQPKNE